MTVLSVQPFDCNDPNQKNPTVSAHLKQRVHHNNYSTAQKEGKLPELRHPGYHVIAPLGTNKNLNELLLWDSWHKNSWLIQILMIPEFETVLVVTIRNQIPQCYQVQGDRIRVGRGNSNHLIIDDQAVSNIHCEFIRDPKSGQWIFRDLGSTNGSQLNGHHTNCDAMSVVDGDEIVLGNVIQIFYLRAYQLEVPESLEEEEDPDVNPVAAAVARQAMEDMEGTQLIKLKANRRK